MRILPATAAAAAALLVAIAPAHAQNSNRDSQRRNGTGQSSQIAQQAMQSGQQPDVLLDVPDLSVEEITLEVNNLQAHIALDARLANLLQLTAGADVGIDNVKLTIKGVHAQATLIVRLENVRAIIERTLQTLDNNPQIIPQLLSTVDKTVGTVGGVANNALPVVGNVANRALPVVGGVANNAVNTVGGVANNALPVVGGVANSALQNGQVLNLASAGLTQVSQAVNGSGQTVRQVRDRTGQLLEVVTDSANRVVSSRRVTGTTK